MNGNDKGRPKCQQRKAKMSTSWLPNFEFFDTPLAPRFSSPNQLHLIFSISETIANLFFSCRRSQESLHSNKARWKYGQNTKQCSDWILIAFLLITAVISPFFNSELGFDQKRKIVDIGVL